MIFLVVPLLCLGTLLVQDAEQDGHERMVALLARIAERSGGDVYVGDGRARALRERLAALPESGDVKTRWEILNELGFEELRLGNFEDAIRLYNSAVKLNGQLTAQMSPDVLNRPVFSLAVAFLRLGETQNCVARHTSASCLLPIGEEGVHVEQKGSRKAIQVLETLLRVSPADWAAPRWLLNIAYMTVGEWPAGVPVAYRISPAVFASSAEFPRFVDVAPERGVNCFNLSGGSVVDDFDGDGHLDIVTSTWDPKGALHYFEGHGDGTFAERSSDAGLDGIVGGLNMIQADYDDDGDLDVLVLRGAWLRVDGAVPNSLLRNDGKGHFRDVTFEAGLGEVHRPTQTADWADYDNDGDLDLFIGNEHDADVPAPCQLFRNAGDGTFVDVASEAHVTNMQYTKAVVWGDYDGDRHPDLFVSNLNAPNRLYRNLGDGHFADQTREAGVGEPHASFPAWFWDFDNDGHLDLFVSTYSYSLEAVAKSYMGLEQSVEIAALYRGDGKGGFEDVAREMGLTRVQLPMGSNYGDLDNDGYPDFYLGTGYPNYEALMPNVMYHNQRGAGFADVTTAGGFGHLQKGHGVSFADLDEDGDQDVYIEMGGAFPGDAFGNALFENPGCDGHWIKVRLVGEQSNGFGVGARIRCEITEDGERRSVYKHVGTGGSFGANPLSVQMIGLGAAERIDVLEIYWPTSDTTQVFRDVAADQLLRIGEGQEEL